MTNKDYFNAFILLFAPIFVIVILQISIGGEFNYTFTELVFIGSVWPFYSKLYEINLMLKKDNKNEKS